MLPQRERERERVATTWSGSSNCKCMCWVCAGRACVAQYYCHFTRTLVDSSPTAVQLLWLSLAAILSTATVSVYRCIAVQLWICVSLCTECVLYLSMYLCPSFPLPSLSLWCCTRPAIYVSFGLQGLLARRLAWSLPQAGRQAGRGAGSVCSL